MNPKKLNLRGAREAMALGAFEGLELALKGTDNDALAAILQAVEELRDAPREKTFGWLLQQIEAWKLDDGLTDKDFATLVIGTVYGMELAQQDIKRPRS